MIDLNNEEEQKERCQGPVPAGSRVLVQLSLQTPNYPSPEDPEVSRAKSGMLQIAFKATVMAGQYENVFWREYITLPIKSQTIAMNENQRTAARIGGSMIRAIIEASRQIDPKATDQSAAQRRRINSWRDLDGLIIPVRVGIDKRPYEATTGKLYWNNRILSVVPVTNKEYRDIMAGKDFINENGAVVGEADNAGNAGPEHVNAQPQRQAGPSASGFDYQTRYVTPADALDEVPF